MRLVLILLLTTAMLSFQTECFGQKFSQEDLGKMVVSVGWRLGSDTAAVGTATILSADNRYFLLTATHVIKALRGDCLIIFSDEQDKPRFITLHNLTKGKPNSWKAHPTADVAAIEIFYFDEWTRNHVGSHSFPISKILTQKESVPVEMDILILGYPIFDSKREYFSALVLRYHFASKLISLPRADTRTLSNFQCLQDPTIQGTSGGPAIVGFSATGAVFGPEQTILVGIVHGTYSDATGGKLGLITPAYYVTELLK